MLGHCLCLNIYVPEEVRGHEKVLRGIDHDRFDGRRREADVSGPS